MGIWDSYIDRVGSVDLRDRAMKRSASYYNRKLPANPSYEEVVIDGIERRVAIIDSDNYEEKVMLSFPGEHFDGGELVEFANTYWLVTSVDARQEFYARAQLTQCNYLLKWITEVDGEYKIIERQCIVSDGTKYLTGETTSSYAENGMVLGDTRISVVFSRDDMTARLRRSNRFIIDDPDSEMPLCYRITKPFKIGGVYSGHGAIGFVMQEVNLEPDDNTELQIADYYKYFPREDKVNEPSDGKKVWL